MDVFIYEAFEEEAAAFKRYLHPQIRVGFTWKTIQEQGDPEPPASLISIRTQSKLPTAWSTKLKGILTRSTGYDHIETYLSQCEKKVQCGYLPLYCTRAVAEHAMMLWMALIRKLFQQAQKFNSFNRDGLTGKECEHRTLLVVGVGNIGYEVVRIGEGLGMKVLGVDIVKKHSSVSYVSIQEGIVNADIIVCAMNLTPENKGYFHYDLLKKAKQGVIFVNIARGELSSSADLLRLLDENHLGGVALDVFNKENELAVSLRTGKTGTDEEVQAALELAKRPDVILTPHNAFNSQEAVERKTSHSVQQINHFLKYGSFLWPVPL